MIELGTRGRLLLLALAFAAQWALPGSWIAQDGWILDHGERVLFRVEPVDPVDAFRGRYVALRFSDQEVPAPTDIVDYGELNHVLLTVDDDGFGRFTAIVAEPPEDGLYLDLRVYIFGIDETTGESTVQISLPHDRFYLPEGVAPEVERLVRARAGGEQPGVWVAARVARGRAVLEELYIDGVPAVRAVRERDATSAP